MMLLLRLLQPLHPKLIPHSILPMMLLPQLHLLPRWKPLPRWQHSWHQKIKSRFVDRDHNHVLQVVRKEELHLVIVGFEKEQ
jgi:hypothetical protein